MHIHKLETGSLHLADWALPSGQTWCVLGNNASGKSLLASAICGESVDGTVEIENPPTKPAWVGFETLQAQYETELANDETDFIDRQDHGSTGLELLLASGATEAEVRAQAERFGVAFLLERGCLLFSSGEIRRIQILAEWLRKPDLLILDEPFDALDVQAYAECSSLFAELAAEGQAILLLVNRLDDVAPWVSHVALLINGRLVHSGPREDVLQSEPCLQMLRIGQQSSPQLPEPITGADPLPIPLLQTTGLSVRYSEVTQFENFDWTLQPGEHTLISGPNGCGKSTLLALLTGDHPQCYTNQIEIFAYRRGTGESIWDIKRHIGYVSPSLHRDYRISCSVETVVVSGFFDSIGLYETPTAQQLAHAREWLSLFELQDHATRSFRTLSFGQQRLIIIARGLVKQPPLLILDEPTQGLDDLNRHLVLASLERLARLKRTTLLFVSHRPDEHLALFQKRILFEASNEDNVRFKLVKSD